MQQVQEEKKEKQKRNRKKGKEEGKGRGKGSKRKRWLEVTFFPFTVCTIPFLVHLPVACTSGLFSALKFHFFLTQNLTLINISY